MGIALLAHRLQMAWQGYIDNNLCGAGLAQAAITGHDGSVWAKSGGFNASAAELQAMATLVGNPAKGMSHMYGGENSKSFKTHQVVTLYTPRTEPLDFALSKLHKLSSWDSMTTNSNLDKPTTLFTELLTTSKTLVTKLYCEQSGY